MKREFGTKSIFEEKGKIADLQKRLRKSGFEVFDLSWDEEHNLYGFEVQESNEERECVAKVHWELITSVEYRQSDQILREIQEMAPPPYTLGGEGKESDHRSGGEIASIPVPGRKGRAEHPEI